MNRLCYIKEIRKYASIFLLFLPLLLQGVDIQPISFSDNEKSIDIGKDVWFIEDVTANLGIEEIIHSKNFIKSKQKVPTFWFTKSNIWMKFKIQNNSSKNDLLLSINSPLIDQVELYYLNKRNKYESINMGQNIDFDERKYKQPGYIYDLNIESGETKEFYLKLKSFDQIQVPLKVTNTVNLFTHITTYNFWTGIYCGIMIIMILYNLFVYFTIRDISYLYYVVYIFAVALTQTTFQGYTFKYLWPSNPDFEIQSILLMSVFVGVTSVAFLRVFTHTKKYLPKWDRLFYGAYIIYGIITIMIFFKMYQISWILILSLVSPLSIFMLVTAYKIAFTGYRPAKFFAISWTIFLVGVFVYAMKDFGILPYNNFTVYTMPIGSAIETVLLSFALADKINIIRAETKQLILNQNVMLEQKVNERTQELNKTLDHLKETQTQLVDAEKMASLGILTAGIAHEINNPINFVSSNIPPLRQDITDLKSIINKYEEINESTNLKTKLIEVTNLKQQLDYEFLKTELDGIIGSIENGANRTTEIVKSLRNFSRLDESDLLFANINEGIDSALVLLRSEYAGIEINKNLGELPKIECYPGKLNQVFLNLLNNAIYAVRNNKFRESVGKIEVKTFEENGVIKIVISDNGIGIKQEFLEKIFDPFFTTKDVGKGTGLGLSIVYRIIESHHGKIEVNSKISACAGSDGNEGTTFIISLPIHQKN